MSTNQMWSPRRQGGFQKISARTCGNPQLIKKKLIRYACVFAVVQLTAQSPTCELLWG